MSNYFRLRRSLHRISPLILKTEKSECAHMFPFGLLDPERSTPAPLTENQGRRFPSDIARQARAAMPELPEWPERCP